MTTSRSRFGLVAACAALLAVVCGDDSSPADSDVGVDAPTDAVADTSTDTDASEDAGACDGLVPSATEPQVLLETRDGPSRVWS